jgi:hypothetical protein
LIKIEGIQAIPASDGWIHYREFPVRISTQGKPCSHYREWVCSGDEFLGIHTYFGLFNHTVNIYRMLIVIVLVILL